MTDLSEMAKNKLRSGMGSRAAANEISAILNRVDVLQSDNSERLANAVPGVPAPNTCVILDDNGATGPIPVLGCVDFVYATHDAVATSDGLTTGTIPDTYGMLQFITVASANANNIVVLPTPVIGTIIILVNAATGYEIRSSSPTTIAINGGTGSAAESAVAANSMVICVCTSLTTWQAFKIAATTLAAAEAAAP